MGLSSELLFHERFLNSSGCVPSDRNAGGPKPGFGFGILDPGLGRFAGVNRQRAIGGLLAKPLHANTRAEFWWRQALPVSLFSVLFGDVSRRGVDRSYLYSARRFRDS